MRSLVCCALFFSCLTAAYVAAVDPEKVCCNLNSEICELDIPAAWFQQNGEGNSAPTWTPYGTLTCGGVEPAPGATDPDASKAQRCGNAKLYKAFTYVKGCTANNMSKTGSKASDDTAVCKEFSRCVWDAENMLCKPQDGYPKQFKVQYVVKTDSCDVAPGGGPGGGGGD